MTIDIPTSESLAQKTKRELQAIFRRAVTAAVTAEHREEAAVAKQAVDVIRRALSLQR